MNLGLFLKKTVDCSMLSMFSWPEAPFDVGLFKVKLYSDCLLCPEKYSHPGYIGKIEYAPFKKYMKYHLHCEVIFICHFHCRFVLRNVQCVPTHSHTHSKFTNHSVHIFTSDRRTHTRTLTRPRIPSSRVWLVVFNA